MDKSMEFRIEPIIRFFSQRILELLFENLFLLFELMLEAAAFFSSFNKTRRDVPWNRSHVRNLYRILLSFIAVII